MKNHTQLLPFSAVLFLLVAGPSCSRLGRHFAPEDGPGSYLVIAVKADPSQLDQAIAQTIAVFEKRCNELAVRCKSERLSGDNANQIKIRYPGVENPERIKHVLLSAGLELRAVVSSPSPAPLQTYSSQDEASTAAGTDKDVLPYLEVEDAESGPRGTTKFVVVERTPIVTGQDVSDAEAVNRSDQDRDYQVTFRLTPAAGQRFGNWTAANINNYLGVVFNKKVRSVAYIKSQITDSGEISGRFTKQAAEDVALVLRSGSLPAPIEAVEEGTYKP